MEQNNIEHEYIAKGPDLYMRFHYPSVIRDCWIAKYASDQEATDAVIAWNERCNTFNKSQQDAGEK